MRVFFVLAALSFGSCSTNACVLRSLATFSSMSLITFSSRLILFGSSMLSGIFSAFSRVSGLVNAVSPPNFGAN